MRSTNAEDSVQPSNTNSLPDTRTLMPVKTHLPPRCLTVVCAAPHPAALQRGRALPAPGAAPAARPPLPARAGLEAAGHQEAGQPPVARAGKSGMRAHCQRRDWQQQAPRNCSCAPLSQVMCPGRLRHRFGSGAPTAEPAPLCAMAGCGPLGQARQQQCHLHWEALASMLTELE
jgi:hypothetical protein